MRGPVKRQMRFVPICPLFLSLCSRRARRLLRCMVSIRMCTNHAFHWRERWREAPDEVAFLHQRSVFILLHSPSQRATSLKKLLFCPEDKRGVFPGARDGTRTHTPFDTRTSNVPVYLFQHSRSSKHGYYSRRRGLCQLPRGDLDKKIPRPQSRAEKSSKTD